MAVRLETSRREKRVVVDGVICGGGAAIVKVGVGFVKWCKPWKEVKVGC